MRKSSKVLSPGAADSLGKKVKSIDSVDGLVKHLEKTLHKASLDRPSPVRKEDGKLIIWASSLGSCPRKLWYFFNDRTGEIPSPISTRMMASVGTDMHGFIQENLKGTIEAIEESHIVPLTKDLNASVRVDGLIKKAKDEALFEMKSVSDYKFKVIQDTKGVDVSYWAQAHVGMLAKKVKHAVFFFMKRPQKARSILTPDPLKDTIAVRSMTFNRDYLKGVVGGLTKKLTGKNPPERLPLEPVKGIKEHVSSVNWECKFCPFIVRCFPKAHVKWKDKGKVVDKPGYFATELVIVPKAS